LRTTVVEYVQQLRGRGYRCASFSKNFDPWIRYQERRLHFPKYFDDILNTQKYNLQKATKKTMRFVCKRYSVKPHEIVYIDDQEQNLIEPRTLGVNTILYTSFKDTRKKITKLVA